jgi:uncharacterized protein
LTLYLDASVIVPAFIDEPLSLSVRRLLGDAAEPTLISDVAGGEFASAVARRFRMALLTGADAQRVLAKYDRWTAAAARPLAIESSDIANATALFRRFDLKLRLPDAIHLAACQRRGLTLATLDDTLADAARALGVAHICPV